MPGSNQRHDPIAVDCAVSLAARVRSQWVDSHGALAVAAVAVAPVRNEQRAPTVLTFFHCAVLIVRKLIFRAHISGTAFEVEDAAATVVAGHER